VVFTFNVVHVVPCCAHDYSAHGGIRMRVELADGRARREGTERQSKLLFEQCRRLVAILSPSRIDFEDV
jgi:hypothetical protein